MSVSTESVVLGVTKFRTPSIENDLGVPATFTTAARLTIQHSSNKVQLASFTLGPTGLVLSQTDLADLTIGNGKTFDFHLQTIAGGRGVLSRVYAYWHTVYSPPFVAAVGTWPQPFPLEYAGYGTNQDGQFGACLGFGGLIARQDPMITATMSSINVPAGTNAFSFSAWKDNPTLHFVLWLEQNQTGSAKLDGKVYAL